MTPDQMITGQTYRATYKLGNQKVPRVLQGTFLGYSTFNLTYQFDLRPHAGTTPIVGDAIIGVEPADTGVHHPPRKVGF